MPTDSLLEPHAPRWAELDHLGHIAVTGPDAIAFLQSQLTQDVAHQPADAARLSGYCQAKGRLLATFLQWTFVDADGHTGVMLQLSRELAAPIAKRLSMYVLRAKAKVADVSDAHATFGVLGLGRQPAWPADVLALGRLDDGVQIRLSDTRHRSRHQLTVPVAARAAARERLAALGAEVAPEVVRHEEVLSGCPRVVAATQERFVPQMINFEVVGGVNCKKGCYPGQEIVARSQYLGKLKRRMFLACLDDPGRANAGDDVTVDGQPVGYVVNAERSAEGHVDLLIETTLDAPSDRLAVNQTGLRLLALPYALPADPVAPATAS
ncbi:folate-binding protein YgfZ [soil metagenome]